MKRVLGLFGSLLLIASAAMGQNYTLQDVAKHNTASDCWMVLNSNKVYDFSTYIAIHPGGSTMVSSCGTNGTSRFNGVGHSGSAVNAEAAYQVGTLVTNPPPVTIGVSINPTLVTLKVNQVQTFTANVTNSTKGVAWSVTGSIGTIVNGVFTPTTIGSGTVVATSVEDATKTAVAKVTVTAPPPPPPPATITVTVAPTSLTLVTGKTQQFTATTQNSSQGVNWTVLGSAGTIDKTGLFTATASGTGSVTATSSEDSSKSATATITVTAPPPPPPPLTISVSILPISPSLKAGTSLVFTASVVNSTQGVNWTLASGGGSIGVLNPKGLNATMIAASPGTATVTATSVEDTSKSASVTVTITPGDPVVIPPGVTLTSTEVAKHATPSDCWMIISGSVYNVTAFIPQHPQNGAAMIPQCGKDATGPFTAATHSSRAMTLLPRFLLGGLVVAPPPPPPTTQQCVVTQQKGQFMIACNSVTPAIPAVSYNCNASAKSSGVTVKCQQSGGRTHHDD